MAKIKKIYDDKLSPENPVEIYPITSTQAVYNTENVTVDALIAEGYRFGGLVEPTDSPALSDTNQRAFYFATKDGIYPNFGNQTVENGRMSIFLWNGSAWGKQSLAVGSANIAGYKVLASVNDLPRQATNLGYLIEDTTLPEGVENQFLYVWVGEGGDTLEGMYQNCGQLRGASAYEVARDNGYEGTQEEWLNDPVNGIKGVGISKWELSQSTADSGVSTITVTLNTGAVETFDVYNGKGIASVEVVGSESSADSATNTYRVTYSDGNHFDFHTKNGKGIASIAIVGSYSDADGATNTYRVTYSDGNHFDFNVKNGNKGNSGYSGAAGELEVVNSLDSTDATAALSAAQGKVLKDLHDTDKNIVNVNDLNGTPTTPYNNADAARIAVSSLSGLRITGQIITYLLADGWHTEQFIGSDVTNWTTASNWLPIAPITVTQNSETGHTDITIGSTTTPVASMEDISQLSQIVKGQVVVSSISIERGQLSETTGNVVSVAYRGTTSFIKSPCKVSLQSGYAIRTLCFYNENKEYLSDWEIFDEPQDEYNITHNGYIRFSMKRINEDTTIDFPLDPTDSINEIIVGNSIKDETKELDLRISAIDTPTAKSYIEQDYSLGWWQINEKMRLDYFVGSGLKYIRKKINPGDVCLVKGEGGVDGRWWYTLNQMGVVVRMADASTSGAATITIEENEVEILTQTRNMALIGCVITPTNSNIAELNTSVEKLKTSKYAGKVFSILGDSISSYGVPNANNADGIYCYPYNYATCRYSRDGGGDGGSFEFSVYNMWWARVIKELGGTLGVNESIRGSFICDTIDPTKAFCNGSRLGHFGYPDSSPDVIIIYGGTNDIGSGRAIPVGTFNYEDPSNYTMEQIAALDTSTFANAVRAMFIRAMKLYPNTEFVVVLPTFTTDYGNMERLDSFIEVYREACDYFGVKAIDIRKIKMNPYNKADYLLDGIHPNAECMKQIADIVIGEMSKLPRLTEFL